MNFSRRGIVITLLAALGLTVTASIGLFASGVPTIFSPFPVLTVLPALMLSGPLQYSAALLPGRELPARHNFRLPFQEVSATDAACKLAR